MFLLFQTFHSSIHHYLKVGNDKSSFDPLMQVPTDKHRKCLDMEIIIERQDIMRYLQTIRQSPPVLRQEPLPQCGLRLAHQVH